MSSVYRWPPLEVAGLKSKLEALTGLVAVSPKELGQEDTTGALARFLVVRSCGYLEQVASEVCRGYITGKSGGPVRAFARSWLGRHRNPTPENLEELVGRFDAQLLDEFQYFLDEEDQRLRRELYFLVDRRNRIAHGLNEGIGSQKAAVLKEVACEVADWFILRFNPNP